MTRRERAEHLAKIAAYVLGYAMVVFGLGAALTLTANTLILGGICMSLGVTVIAVRRITDVLESVYLEQLRDRHVVRDGPHL